MYVCVLAFQCAVTCGHGYQMRAVRCVSGNYGDTVDDRECNAAVRPRDNQVKENLLVTCKYNTIALVLLPTNSPDSRILKSI